MSKLCPQLITNYMYYTMNICFTHQKSVYIPQVIIKQLNSKLPWTITRFIWCISILTFTNSNCSTYTGLTSNTFKQRYYGHRHSFKKRDSDHSTTLSSHIWDLKDENKNYEIQWSIIDRAPDCIPITRICGLWIKEKCYVIFQPEGASFIFINEV